MESLEAIEKFWTDHLTGKTITRVLFDVNGLAGFILNDGIRVGYSYKTKGIYIETDKKTGLPNRYN